MHARMCVAFARMVLMHINVKIFSATRSRPLTQVSFREPYVSIILWHTLVWYTVINIAKLSWRNRSSLMRWSVMVHMYWHSWLLCCLPPNLLLNTTSRAHSVKHVKQAQIARPQKSTTWSCCEDIIRRLNHLHYISSDHSCSVKNSSNNRLSKTFRLC